MDTSQDRGLTDEELAEITACPHCGTDLPLPVREHRARCERCQTEYRRLAYGWDLTAPERDRGDALWATWDTLQANGVVSYESDPEHNLAVGDREDCLEFGRFCALGGLVLDVGCGPQAWPTHFDTAPSSTRFVGIDPLVGDHPAVYAQIRALAEFLPFRDNVFDHVVFSGTLDHFVDPARALREAARAVAVGGTIEVVLGHKRSDAPPPVTSHAWYERLHRPEGADDAFHVKRLDAAKTGELFAAAGLRIIEREVMPVDAYRTTFFYRLTV
jgi:SAM-dependent methyltransferase